MRAQTGEGARVRSCFWLAVCWVAVGGGEAFQVPRYPTVRSHTAVPASGPARAARVRHARACSMQAGVAAAGGTATVRSFRSSDAVHVRRIFSEGMKDLIFDGFRALTGAVMPLIAAAGAAVGAAVFAGFGCSALISCLTAAAVISAILGLAYLQFRRQVLAYVDQSLSDDLSEIEAFYLKGKSHFWVAVEQRADGTEEVLGCVALEHKTKGKYSGWGELRRMSVCRSARRRGVAGKLHDALLEHGKRFQITGVFLSTSTMQPAAVSLYQRLGYSIVGRGSFLPFPLLERAVQFVSFERPLPGESS